VPIVGWPGLFDLNILTISTSQRLVPTLRDPRVTDRSRAIAKQGNVSSMVPGAMSWILESQGTGIEEQAGARQIAELSRPSARNVSGSSRSDLTRPRP